MTEHEARNPYMEMKSFKDAYHDCNLVADSIVDAESFQKADSGLVLHYIRNIVKALEKQVPKPLYGNDENPVHIGDTVSGLCPNCLTQFVCITPRYYRENGYGYCKQCGQKLEF